MTLPPSDHFNGKTFFNPRHEDRTWLDVLRWRRTSVAKPWSVRIPFVPQPPPPRPNGDEFVVTWIGHATFLIQTAQGSFLTDPHFSECCGPFGRFGPRRVLPPGIALGALPRIDSVLLSHDHYDHCDLASLRALAKAHHPVAITPLANGSLLRRAGLNQPAELDWWQTHSPAAGVEVTLTPARHWSNRLTGRRNSRLWGGFFARHGARSWWFAGDTGYDPVLFREIREHLGAPTVAMIPIGAYEPRWFMAAQHCNPAEAVLIHLDVGATVSIAMHWGTWQLTDEEREEPARALETARREAGVTAEAFRVLAAGETLVNRTVPTE